MSVSARSSDVTLPDLAAVRRACAPGGARSVYQPIVRLSDGVAIGFEALGRVNEDFGLGPADWLQIAERHGLRVDLELAFLRAAAPIEPPPGNVPLFVNVSAATLLDRRLEDVLRSLPTHVLELSEHDRVEDYAQLLPRLRDWRSRGTFIAIDDVGAGYANMAHVLQLDPRYIKIDRGIVAGVDSDPRRRALVAALHTLATAAGAISVAEGVERREELDVLRQLGIDAVQGYLLARPGPAWPGIATLGLKPLPLQADLSLAADARACAQSTTTALAADPDFLPSVYLARGGRLRCLARHGQWLVLDGIEPGMGLTGAAYAGNEEVIVHDVTGDPRYRQAVVDVRSEFALPLRAAGRLVGVLNVDSRRRLTDTDEMVIRRAATMLEQRLAVVGVGEEQDTVLQILGRVAPPIAMAHDLPEVAQTTIRAALELAVFDTACLWSCREADCQLLLAQGSDADLLAGLANDDVEALRELVRDIASCHSTGTELDLSTGPVAAMREIDIEGFVLVPLRDGRRLTGLLLLTRRHATTPIAAETVQAAELIGLQSGSRAAALERLTDLEQRAAQDPLTGVGNRTRLDNLFDNSTAAEPLVGGWLVTLDLDRFKGVNDRYGHAAGDEVLRAVAETLSETPGRPPVMRLGGDEFVMLLGPSCYDDARQLCELVRERVQYLLHQYDADLSIGLAAITAADGLRTSMIRADEALYLRKRSGGGGVTCWTASVPRQHAVVREQRVR